MAICPVCTATIDKTRGPCPRCGSRLQTSWWKKIMKAFVGEQPAFLNPRSVEAYTGRGNAYVQQGRYELAIKLYGEAIRLDPTCADAYNNRGAAHPEPWAVRAGPGRP